MLIGDSLVNSLGEGIFMLNLNGNIVACNIAGCRITGYDDGEMEQQPFHMLTNDGDIIKFQHELNLAMQTGKLVGEGWKHKKGGTKFWAETTVSPIYDNAGQHTGYVVLLRDLSEKKEQLVELRANEERYRLMVEAVKDYSIFMLDPLGHVVTWNDGGQLIHGYSENEIIGKHFSIFYTASDLRAQKAADELRIAAEQGSYSEEGWRLKKGGVTFWASVVLTALFNDQNKLIGFSKVTRDLTDRLKTDEILRQSEARYRSLVEQVSDYGIFMLDQKGRIASWNEGARKIKGYAAEDVIGKYFSIFYPEEDIRNEKPKRELLIARAEGKYEEEGWRLRKDGSRFWANVVITAVYDTDNKLTGFSKVTRDLTERKRNEQALQESTNRYRLLASELSITNAELTEANKELEQFSTIVSHDLKEPVRSVKSFLRLIDHNIEQGRLENIKTYTEKGIRAAERMQSLIDNLLHYSQISKSPLAMEDQRVDELIDAAMQNLSSTIDSSGAQINVTSTVEIISCDRVQLLQLIQNLLANAIKFTNDKVPVINVHCFWENGNVKFSFADNGIGIPKQKLEAIFEIFKRLHFAGQYPGNGVGLAVCKKVVERHRGEIWAESEEGTGTTFYVVLPQTHTQKDKGNEEV